MSFRYTREHKKNLWRSMVTPLLCFAFMSYFILHGVRGELGWFAHTQLKHQTQVLQQELNQIQDLRKNMARRVSFLRPENLDWDMIDERARATLNVVHPHDRVILRTVHRTASITSR